DACVDRAFGLYLGGARTRPRLLPGREPDEVPAAFGAWVGDHPQPGTPSVVWMTAVGWTGALAPASAGVARAASTSVANSAGSGAISKVAHVIMRTSSAARRTILPGALGARSGGERVQLTVESAAHRVGKLQGWSVLGVWP